MDSFAVQSLDARIVAQSTEDGFGGMKNRDVLDGFSGWTCKDRRGPNEGRILLVE